MAEKLIVRCPSCNAAYRVPPEGVGRKARCPKCKTKFVVALSKDQSDELPLTGSVAEPEEDARSASGTFAGISPADSFVAKALRGEEPDQPVSAAGSTGAKKAPDTPQPMPEAEPSEPGARIILERIDEMGAYFEFATEQLRDANLRASFPRRCVACGCREPLNIHLVVFTDRLPARDAFRAKELEVRDFGQLGDYGGADGGADLIEQLPTLPHLPEPFNLPFPYFVCDRCSAIGEVNTHVLRHGRVEFCQINIANLRTASEVYSNNGGGGTDNYRKLLKAADQQRHDRWRGLPLTVRNRIRQWFQPRRGERFVDYFPDEDFSKSEAGLAGLVLTNRRLIYKKYAAQREYSIGVPGEVRLIGQGKLARVEVIEKGKRPAVVNLDASAAETLLDRLKAVNSRLTVTQ